MYMFEFAHFSESERKH